jgi:hypothetical protein
MIGLESPRAGRATPSKGSLLCKLGTRAHGILNKSDRCGTALPYRTYRFGHISTVTPASRVARQGGNVFLSDWGVKILTAGSDAVVTRLYCVDLGGFLV